MSRLLPLIVLTLLISGCGGVCIEPGKGVSSNSVVVQVPVQPAGSSRQNPATYWVNSGHSVEAGRELKLTVENTINLCPKDASTIATVRMFPENFAYADRPEHEFYDTLLDVVKGDRVTFSPFLYDLELPSCEKIGNEESFIIYYGNSDFYRDSGCKRGIDAKDICSSGAYGGSASLYRKSDGGRCEEIPQGIELPKFGDSAIKISRLAFPLGYMSRIGKEPTRSVLTSDSQYMVATGRIHDGRTIKIGDQEITDDVCRKLKESGFITREIEGRNLAELKRSTKPGYKKRQQHGGQNNSAEDAKYDAILRGYTEYDINCRCGLICTPSQQVNEPNCTRSIVHVIGDKIMCPTPKLKKNPPSGSGSTSSGELKLEEYLDFSLPNDDSAKISDSAYEMAEGAIAVIRTGTASAGTTNTGTAADITKSGCGSGTSCKFLPEGVHGVSAGGTFKERSLKMHTSYEVPDSGRLFLSYLKDIRIGGSGRQVQSSDAKMQGFYTLNVHRTCYATSGKKLYMYIGKEAPKFLPGSGTGKGEIELDLEQDNSSTGIYIINKEGGSSTDKSSGNLYFGIEVDEKYDSQLKDGNYPDNYYAVRLWIPTWEPIISKFFALLQGILLNVLYGTAIPGSDDAVADISSAVGKSFEKALDNRKSDGALQQIFNNQVSSKPFWMLVQGVLTLFLMFSAIGYVMGVIKITKYDLVIRIAKIVLLISLFSPGSWKFFNEHCFGIFIGGVSEIITAFNGYLDGDTSFKFLDATLGLLLTSELWIRLFALVAAGPVGWLVFIGVIWGLIAFFLAMIEVMIKYLFLILAVAFLITLAPIFLSFILFQRTKNLFDGWLKLLMNFSLQPIVIFTSIAFLNQMILSSLHSVTDFTACESCAIGINIPSDDPGTPNRPDICLLPVMLPIGFSNELSVNDRHREGLAREDVGFMGLPFGLAVAMMLIFCCKAIREFVSISEAMVLSISGSVAGITASAVGATQSMLGIVGLDAASQQRISAAAGMTPPGEDRVQFENRDGVRPMQEGADGSEPSGAGSGGDAAAVAPRTAMQDVGNVGAGSASEASASGGTQAGSDSVSGSREPRAETSPAFGASESLLGDEQLSGATSAAVSDGDGGISRPDGLANAVEAGADSHAEYGDSSNTGDAHVEDVLSGADDAVARSEPSPQEVERFEEGSGQGQPVEEATATSAEEEEYAHRASVSETSTGLEPDEAQHQHIGEEPTGKDPGYGVQTPHDSDDAASGGGAQAEQRPQVAKFVDHLSDVEDDEIGHGADKEGSTRGVAGGISNRDDPDGEPIEEKLNKSPDNDTPAEE
ncbi:type IV secretion system protein [Anaplasma capra]|uniref:type IV secretion system protein n=1 Tax=Anaplasma capra TaxID=1562740 RepID=UPI0021D5E15E|nr:type IV secretion system protein [Anaplasma capra]MCU7611545.1 type IV secretion system protein [Anaplasma capra]